MSPLVFSLRVCGVLLAFCGWGPWDPPLTAPPDRRLHLCLEHGLEHVHRWGGALGPPLQHLQTGDSPLCVEHGLEHLHRWVRRRGTQPRRKLLRCLFGRWPLEDRRAEKEAATEPLRNDLLTGLLEKRLVDRAFGRERFPGQGFFLGLAGVHWPEFVAAMSPYNGGSSGRSLQYMWRSRCVWVRAFPARR